MIRLKRFEFNPFGENTYLVWDADTLEAAIIDPGMSSVMECDQVDSFLSDYSLKLKAILLTHIHIDHILGLQHLKQKYGAEVIAHQADEFLGQRCTDQARMFHLPYEVAPVAVDRFIEEGIAIKLGHSEVKALHAPGHSPGSLLYYIPSGGILFSGDVLFLGSIGRTDLPGGDYATLISSIHKKILTLPVTTKVYPGHGPSTTIADEMRSNPYI